MSVPGMEPARATFLGLDFSALTQEAALDWVKRQALANDFGYVVTPNVDHVISLDEDPSLISAYRSAALLLCDSAILQLLASWSGTSLTLVTGSDLTARLLASPLDQVSSLALVGGNVRQLEWLRQRYPKLTIHHLAPPFGLRHNPAARSEVVDFVNQSKAQITLLTVGAPQSELIAEEIQRRGGAHGVCLCIGASLEFLVGEKPRAPHWMRKARLEWLFRLMSEPNRLWRRYMLRGPRILTIWIGSLLGKR